MARSADILASRVDQVGSLLRPAPLIAAFLACARGDIVEWIRGVLGSGNVRKSVFVGRAAGGVCGRRTRRLARCATWSRSRRRSASRT